MLQPDLWPPRAVEILRSTSIEDNHVCRRGGKVPTTCLWQLSVTFFKALYRID